MNMVARVETPPVLAMNEGDAISVLQNSLYPGAALPSIKMVLSYCKAAGLDPMQKPVHIVPMPVKTGQKDRNGYDETVMRDVVMPGIGLYRTQAARSGQYAGMSEPEFGPVVDDPKLGRYPEWCRITVRRMVGDQVVEFTAKEYWIENYAAKSRNDSQPNAMWRKRPFGQLAKCTEAQALRKAFPELVSAEATAEEVEGKDIVQERDITPVAESRPALPEVSDEEFKVKLGKWRPLVEGGTKTAEEMLVFATSRYSLSESQQNEIRALKKQAVAQQNTFENGEAP